MRNRRPRQFDQQMAGGDFRIVRWRLAFAGVLVVFASLPAPFPAQEFPREIRGYRVHSQKVVVASSAAPVSMPGEPDALVTIGDPIVSSLSPGGISLEVPAEIRTSEHSGTVDFLTFRDIRVNGVPVDVEEYSTPFILKKNDIVKLPRAIKVRIRATGILQAAWMELVDPRTEWTVRGRVFVFGKFRKYGFNFKRVVPVDVSVKIRNPLLTGGPSPAPTGVLSPPALSYTFPY